MAKRARAIATTRVVSTKNIGSIGSAGRRPPEELIKIRKLVAIDFNCNEIYGVVPTTAIIVTRPPNADLFPYREAIKSAIEVMRCCLQIRIIFIQTNDHKTKTKVGPKYMGRKSSPVVAALPTLP